jgi:uncharacterized protein YndB with AHSA1/START domain
MTPTLNADGVFSSRRLYPFSSAQIFAAFANADQLALWWGPDGFSNTFELFEFKPQGRWKFVMHGPDGTNYPNENIFLEVSPRKIVIQHVCAPHFTLAVSWADHDGQTQLDWQQAFGDASLAQSIADIVLPANEQNLNRLHAVLLAARE